jgi:hypothetical protein
LLAPGKWQYVRGWTAARGSAGIVAPRLSIDEYLIDRQERWLVGRTYVVGGHSVSSEFAAQLLYGFSTLTNPAPAGVIALAVQCDADCGAAHTVMQRFWSGMAGPLVDTLPTDMVTAPRL